MGCLLHEWLHSGRVASKEPTHGRFDVILIKLNALHFCGAKVSLPENIMTIGGNFEKSYEQMSCKISPAIRSWHKYHLPVRFITMGYTWSFTTGWIWPFLQNEQRKGLCEATYLFVKWGRFFDITVLSVLICCYQYSLHFSTAKSLRLCDAYICVSRHGLRWFK